VNIHHWGSVGKCSRVLSYASVVFIPDSSSTFLIPFTVMRLMTRAIYGKGSRREQWVRPIVSSSPPFIDSVQLLGITHPTTILERIIAGSLGQLGRGCMSTRCVSIAFSLICKTVPR
jgi:hypothetical protein